MLLLPPQPPLLCCLCILLGAVVTSLLLLLLELDRLHCQPWHRCQCLLSSQHARLQHTQA
jgi:hypothetical protein